MAKKNKQPSFDDILQTLRGYKFDVTPASAVANPSQTMRISKYGCAALLAPSPVGPSGSGLVTASGPATAMGRGSLTGKAPKSGGDQPAAAIVGRPGIVVGDEIGHILDKGFQKFVKTPHAEVPATADHLRSLHRFTEELCQATGNVSLYNQSLGTVSDEYMYDRVKGRNLPESERPAPAWALPGKTI